MRRQAVASPGTAPRSGFFADIVAELKKVTWPTRPDTVNLTVMVILFSAAVGLALGVVDYFFSSGINLLLLRGP
ncbi:MAG: preprotein translocase subunit SecE [Chloroflexi bacterium]|nr:preprotein translocase subunit SecE [Chloroflexota bacterium]